MVVAVAGNITHGAVTRQVRKAFARHDFLAGESSPVLPDVELKPRRVSAGRLDRTRGFEQVNVVLGANGMTRHDPRRYALGVLNAALGGGTSSRLFQEVRERRGLAYSVYSFASHHADAGLVGVSLGCLPGKLDDALATVRGELAKVAADGITDDELERGKGQLRGGLVLGMEDTGSRMSRIGKAELVYNQQISLDEVVRRIDAVTGDLVREVAAEMFGQPEILAVVGP